MKVRSEAFKLILIIPDVLDLGLRHLLVIILGFDIALNLLIIIFHVLLIWIWANFRLVRGINSLFLKGLPVHTLKKGMVYDC